MFYSFVQFIFYEKYINFELFCHKLQKAGLRLKNRFWLKVQHLSNIKIVSVFEMKILNVECSFLNSQNACQS